MSGFFEELQRRKVYRVAAAYIVVAGFLIQIASAAFPALASVGLPPPVIPAPGLVAASLHFPCVVR